MFVWEFVIALLLAALVTAFLVGPAHRHGPGPLSGAVFFFMLALLVIWGLGVWIAPMGPQMWGIQWLGFLLIGLFVALFVAALVPPAIPPAPVEKPTAEEAETVAVAAFGMFFWLLLIILIIGLAVHYMSG